MDNKIIQQISERMRDRSTEELTTILSDNDTTQWSPEAFEAIRRVLSEREHHTAWFQSLEDDNNIDGLLLIIADQTHAYSDHDRREAANTLIKLKDVKVAPGLLKIATNLQLPLKTRALAFNALSKINDHQIVADLVELLKDRSDFLRESAMETLLQMEGTQDVSEVKKTIEEYHHRTQLSTRTRGALFAQCNYFSFVLGIVLIGGILVPVLIGIFAYSTPPNTGSLISSLREVLPFFVGQLSSSILFAASLHRNGKIAWLRFILWGLAIIVIPRFYSATAGSEMIILGGVVGIGLFVLSGYAGVLTKGYCTNMIPILFAVLDDFCLFIRKRSRH